MLVTFKVKISIKHLEVTTTILLLIVLEGKLVMLVTGFDFATNCFPPNIVI